MPQTVAIIGASADRAKYGNKAVRAYRDAGWNVFPINPALSEVEGLPCYPGLDRIPSPSIDRVSFYVPPEIGLTVLNQLGEKAIGEIWLNPGAESDAIRDKAAELGLTVVEGCAILGAGRNPGQY